MPMSVCVRVHVCLNVYLAEKQSLFRHYSVNTAQLETSMWASFFPINLTLHTNIPQIA